MKSEAKQRIARLALVLVAASVVSPLLNDVSPAHAFVVASGSMEPFLPTGSLALAKEGEPKVGDVIVYWSPVGANQVHRIVRAEVRPDGATHYLTRGDANGAGDSFVVHERDVLGIVEKHVPYMGYLWMIPAALQAALFGSLLAGYLALTLWDARQLLHPRRTRALGVLLVLLLLLCPVAGAAVQPVFPASPLTFGIATTPLPHQAGTMGSATITSGDNRATVTAAAPKLWKEISMWNCQKDSTCVLTVNSNGYGEQIGSWARVNVADYSPAPTFFFEAYMKAGTGGTTSAILRDKTSVGDIALSEVSTTSTSLTLVRSAAFTLSGDKDYTISTKKATANGELHHARLVSAQQFATKTVEQVRLMQGDQSLSSTWAVPSRATQWSYDGSSTDGVTAAYFEVVGEVDGSMLTASQVRLRDRTAGTTVATLTIGILDTAATRFRSADIKASLVDGHLYEVEVLRGDGLLNDKVKIYVARVLVLQSAFTKTVRYVDLSWTATTTATTFTTVGYPGRYHMDSELGGIQGYFEVTMKNSNAGQTSSAQLYDNTAGAAVSGSQVDVTGTTSTRVRSGLLTLNTANVTYSAQLKATANTAEVRSAWLIVLQTDEKTYDHMLRTRNDVVNACTWSFTLQHTADSNLARIAEASVALRGASTATQIVVANGAVTQSTGSAVSVAFGSSAAHVVATRPTSAGSSTLDADLLGTCVGSGIRTAQPLVVTFG